MGLFPCQLVFRLFAQESLKESRVQDNYFDFDATFNSKLLMCFQSGFYKKKTLGNREYN